MPPFRREIFVMRIGYGNATLVILGELQEASRDELICLIRERADQFRLLAISTSLRAAASGSA